MLLQVSTACGTDKSGYVLSQLAINKMAETKCSCSTLERLEGASVPAYISAYLKLEEKNRYRCQSCGREWEKRTPENEKEGKRPSLVRLN